MARPPITSTRRSSAPSRTPALGTHTSACSLCPASAFTSTAIVRSSSILLTFRLLYSATPSPPETISTVVIAAHFAPLLRNATTPDPPDPCAGFKNTCGHRVSAINASKCSYDVTHPSTPGTAMPLCINISWHAGLSYIVFTSSTAFINTCSRHPANCD